MSRTTQTPHTVTVYWLITKNENGRTEMLAIDRGGEEMLPIFSFEEEAEMFLALGTLGVEWSLRQTTAGELVSILMGPCADVDLVALDPLPEMVSRGMPSLVSLDRKRFMHRLIERANREKAASSVA